MPLMKATRSPGKLRYLAVQDAETLERISAALARMNSSADWEYVREHLLEATRHQAEALIRDLEHTDPALPAQQGIARVLGELIDVSREAVKCRLST